MLFYKERRLSCKKNKSGSNLKYVLTLRNLITSVECVSARGSGRIDEAGDSEEKRLGRRRGQEEEGETGKYHSVFYLH